MTVTVDASTSANSATNGAPSSDENLDREARAKVLREQAKLALAAGDHTKALELIDASLVLHRTARSYLVRAQSLEQLGRIDEALVATEAAAKIAPRYATIYEIRGNLLWSQKRWAAAREAYYHVLELEPNSRRAAEIRTRLQEQP
jgi:pre-mRNA-processing factor 6